MHTTFRLLTTVAILITLADHPMYGAQSAGGKDYFIVELYQEEGDDEKKDEFKRERTFAHCIVHQSTPNKALLAWMQQNRWYFQAFRSPDKDVKDVQYYHYVGSNKNRWIGKKDETSFLKDHKQTFLTTETLVKASIKAFIETSIQSYMREEPHPYLLVYHNGSITPHKLTDTDLTKPFRTWQKPPAQGGRPQDPNPQGDHTLLYILGGVVVCGIGYVVLGAKEDTPTSTSGHREKAKDTAK